MVNPQPCQAGFTGMYRALELGVCFAHGQGTPCCSHLYLPCEFLLYCLAPREQDCWASFGGSIVGADAAFAQSPFVPSWHSPGGEGQEGMEMCSLLELQGSGLSNGFVFPQVRTGPRLLYRPLSASLLSRPEAPTKEVTTIFPWMWGGSLAPACAWHASRLALEQG